MARGKSGKGFEEGNEDDLLEYNEIEDDIIEEDSTCPTILKTSKIDLNIDSSFYKSKNFDFSGFLNATDFTFYILANHFKNHPQKNEINFDEISVIGCKYLTIWSLNYLYMSVGKTIYDLCKSKFSVNSIIFCVSFNSSNKL